MIEKLKQELTEKRKKETPIPAKDLLSTGSTLLNLALSGKPQGGLTKGRYFFFVGDSSSGKSFLCLTCLAEAALSKSFKDYRFIYDNAEDGILMDMKAFFGPTVANKLEPPKLVKGEPVYSETLDDFYFHLDDAYLAGKPFIYILDSMDALSTEEEIAKAKEKKSAKGKAREVTGSYGTSKAKGNSAGIREALPKLRKLDSILIVISQTRDNIGFGAQFNPKTRSGGHALRFYATCEIWSSIKKHIKKPYKGKDRELGILSQIKVKKNRITGRERTVEIPIFHSMGIDDVGSMVDYLVEESHWSESKGVISTQGWITEMKREALIRHIEREDLERELKVIVTSVWNEIEEAVSVKRKSRYNQGEE